MSNWRQDRNAEIQSRRGLHQGTEAPAAPAASSEGDIRPPVRSADEPTDRQIEAPTVPDALAALKV